MSQLRVVFMGTPDFSVGIMEKMLEQGIQLVGCVTVADKPAGRGQQLHESPVKRFALEQSIPVLQPLKLKDEAFLNDLRALAADVFVVVVHLECCRWKSGKCPVSVHLIYMHRYCPITEVQLRSIGPLSMVTNKPEFQPSL